MRALLVLLMLTLTTLRAQATELPEGEELHASTLEACRGISAEETRHAHLKIHRYLSGRTGSKSFDELLMTLEGDSASRAWNEFQYRTDTTNTKWILIQEPLKRALNECYNTDQKAIQFFVKVIVAADARGKLASGANLAVSFWAVGRIANGIYSVSKFAGRALNLVMYASIPWELTNEHIRSQEFRKQIQEECAAAKIECSSDPAQAGLQLTAARAAQIRESQKNGDEISAAHFFEGVVVQEIQNLRNDLVTADPAKRESIQKTLAAKTQFLINVVGQERVEINAKLDSASEAERPAIRKEVERLDQVLAHAH